MCLDIADFIDPIASPLRDANGVVRPRTRSSMAEHPPLERGVGGVRARAARYARCGCRASHGTLRDDTSRVHQAWSPFHGRGAHSVHDNRSRHWRCAHTRLRDAAFNHPRRRVAVVALVGGHPSRNRVEGGSTPLGGSVTCPVRLSAQDFCLSSREGGCARSRCSLRALGRRVARVVLRDDSLTGCHILRSKLTWW